MDKTIGGAEIAVAGKSVDFVLRDLLPERAEDGFDEDKEFSCRDALRQLLYAYHKSVKIAMIFSK